LLTSRCADYSPQRLDELFLSGLLTWFRPLNSAREQQLLVAATPVAIVPRKHAGAWQAAPMEIPRLPEGAAARLLGLLEQGGALFSDDLERESGLLRTQFEQALALLVAQGLITADAFSPLRWLIRSETSKRKREKALRRRGMVGQRIAGNGLLGRWSAITGEAGRDRAGALTRQALLAIQCEALLRRYGVVFRAVLERESLLQPWRNLLRYFRRMEDRGEVHGGRFVDGFSGEQFALPEAVGLLRRHEASSPGHVLRVINATDPLNLGGIITPGEKTPALGGNRVLLADGIPAARLIGGEIELLKGAPVNASEAERYLRVVVGARRTAGER